jgi:hypothetical protein
MSMELEDDGLAQIRHKELLASNNGVKAAIEKLADALNNLPKPVAPIVNVPKMDSPIVNVQTNNDEIKGLIQRLENLMAKQPTPIVEQKKRKFVHTFNRDRNGFTNTVETNEI